MTIILGIDPGSRRTGFGVLCQEGQQLRCLGYGVINAIRTPAMPLAERLVIIGEGLQDILKRYQPQEAAVEQVFMAKNARSALILGQARGVALFTVGRMATVTEYAPRAVKQAVVGYGQADKLQMQDMIQRLLGLAKKPAEDAADALAVAWCHAQARKVASPIGIGSRV